MSDALPDPLTAVPPPRDRRIAATAAASAALHLLLIGSLVLPRMSLPEPTEPPAVNVDLVPPPSGSSLETPSSQMLPSSTEAPSSDAPSSDSTSSAAASSVELPSSASSAAAAASEPASDAASSVTSEAAASEQSASVTPPVPMARPIVIPVGPSAQSSEEVSSAVDTSASEEPSSAASELTSSGAPSGASGETSVLTTTNGSAADAVDAASSQADTSAAAIPASLTGALHAAKRHYLEAMLNAPAMARAREAIKKLPPDKRLTQTCNIEAVGQIGNAGNGYEPDAVIADAFAKPRIGGTTFAVPGGAFRSKQKWYGVAYDCTLSDDMSTVKSFSFRIGAEVTAALKARVGG